MKRLHTEDINTPQHFDSIWAQRELHRYDTELLEAFAVLVKDNDAVCDLGAGCFGVAEYVADKYPSRGRLLVAVDFSKKAKELVDARGFAKLRYVCVDILRSGLLDGEFDVVLASEVIEHMVHPFALVQEMSRLCRPGGLLLISTVNTRSADAIKHGDYPEHLWEFSAHDLLELFSTVGVATVRLVGNYHFLAARKH